MLDTMFADPDVGKTAYQRYRAEMNSIDLLSSEEVYALGTRIRDNQDPEAIKRLTTSYLRLTAKVAVKYLWSKTLFEDLIQAGNVGLIKAAQIFDPDKAKFSTFAMKWIDWGIKELVCQKRPRITLLEDEPGCRHIPDPRTQGDDFLIAKQEYMGQLSSLLKLFQAINGELGLSERDKLIFYRRYDFRNPEYDKGDADKGEFCTLDELAAISGLSRQGVSKVLARIWAKAEAHGLVSSWKELREELALMQRLKELVHTGG